MPKRDGTGPKGEGPETGLGRKNQGSGKGRGGGFRAGPGGFCVCPKCGTTVPHQTGEQCFERKCTKCGELMTRQ